MGLYVKQQDTRSPLQEKLAKELQERARQKSAETDLPDGVDDSRYIEGTQQTTKSGILWIIIAVAAIACVIWLVVSLAQ